MLEGVGICLFLHCAISAFGVLLLMSTFLGPALAPFILALMLLVAWPIKRAIQLYMKDGKLKRFLLFKW